VNLFWTERFGIFKLWCGMLVTMHHTTFNLNASFLVNVLLGEVSRFVWLDWCVTQIAFWRL